MWVDLFQCALNMCCYSVQTFIFLCLVLQAKDAPVVVGFQLSKSKKFRLKDKLTEKSIEKFAAVRTMKNCFHETRC